MKCLCCSGEAKYFAKFRNRNCVVRRFRCQRCGKTFSEPQPFDGLRVETGKITDVVRLLCEGVGIKAASRLTGLEKKTVLNIPETLGEKCARFHDATVRNLKIANVETDELYSKVFCKQDQNKSGSDERGDQYTYVSFCRDLKLIISFYTGKRSRENTRIHVQGLHGRLAGRTQITTDNYVAYRGKRGAIANTFGRDGVDYGMLTKVYAKSLLPENRYAPPVCILSKKTAIFGQPNRDTICTSHVERQNLNFRQFNRRFTRLILGYLNKLKTCAIRLLCSPASGISVGNTRPQNERRHKRQD